MLCFPCHLAYLFNYGSPKLQNSKHFYITLSTPPPQTLSMFVILAVFCSLLPADVQVGLSYIVHQWHRSLMTELLVLITINLVLSFNPPSAPTKPHLQYFLFSISRLSPLHSLHYFQQ